MITLDDNDNYARDARQRDQEEHCRGGFGWFFCVFYRGVVILFVRIMIMIIVGSMCENCNKKKNKDGAPLGAFSLISHESDVAWYSSTASKILQSSNCQS